MIIVFFTVVSAVAYFVTHEAINQFIVSDASTSLSFIINNVKTNYEYNLMALDEIASMDGFLPFEPRTARGVVRDFLDFPNIFNTVHLYRTDGALLFAEKRASMGSYNPRPNFYLKDPDFISLAKTVIAEKHSRASKVFYTPSGTLYQTYITPVFADREKKEVFGILSGGVFPRLQRIDYLLHGLQLGQDNFILISDSNGHFLTSDGITEKDAAAAVQKHTDQAARLFYGSTASDETKALISQKLPVLKRSYIIMSLPIQELKLIVTLGVSTGRVEAKSRELFYNLLVALVLGLLLSLAASIVVGDRLAKPLRQIADAISEINKGNFAIRVGYSGEDEIGYLSNAVNLLAEKIQKSEYLGNLWCTEEELARAETEGEGHDEADSEGSPPGESSERNATEKASETPDATKT